MASFMYLALFPSIILLGYAQYSVQQHSNFWEHDDQARKYDDSVYHNFIDEENMCTDRSFQQRLMAVTKESLCGDPLDTIIALRSKEPHLEFVPSHVKVKQCIGSCSMALSCMPSMEKQIPIEVRIRNRLTHVTKCGEVMVPEHQKCMCKCTVMEHHCKPHEEYRKNECMCRCKNQTAMDDCISSGKIWNPSTCGCDCLVEKECTTGLLWVPSKCECMKMMFV